MQAAKRLFDAVKSNDVPTVRKCLDLGTDADLAHVRYHGLDYLNEATHRTIL